MCGPLRFGGFPWRLPVVLIVAGLVSSVAVSVEGGMLDDLRDDVRSEGDPSHSETEETYHPHCEHNDVGDSLLANLMWNLLSGMLSSSERSGGPIMLDAYFPRYPYENGNTGYLMTEEYTSPLRRWAARARCDYSEDFDDLSRIGGHLLLSTTSRWGLDTEMNYLQEHLPDRSRDRLWLGDCNLVLRNRRANAFYEAHLGLGFNWLDDPIETNYGFNFTCGFDLYPIKPLVFSTEIDWGTIGSAEAFHFRTTAGVVVHGLEAYVGYEYRDIDRFYFNGLIAGVRVWF